MLRKSAWKHVDLMKQQQAMEQKQLAAIQQKKTAEATQEQARLAQQAAAKTWSGRLATEYGFTEVHIVVAGGTVPGLPNIKNQVEVIFLRKNQTSK